MDVQQTRVPDHRADILEFLETRIATIDQIARRFFPGGSPETSRKKASRLLTKEQRRKRVRVRGVVYLKTTGRPQVVFGRRCKSDQLEHDVLVTEAEILMN